MNQHFSIIWGTRRIARPQLDIYIASAIKHLKGIAIKPGMRVAICEENCIEYVILLIALWQMKVVAVPINPRWPQKAIHSYTSKLGIVHLFKGIDLKHIVCFDARHEASSLQEVPLDLDQEATIIATSGSEGEPKPAVHTWGNHFYNAKGSMDLIPLTKDDRWLLSLPLYHVAGIGILVRCLISGASIVMGTGDDLASSIERSKVTHVSLVSTQLWRLLTEEKNRDVLKRLKCILLGGSAIPYGLLEQSVKLGANVFISYGLTEMASQVATGKVVDPNKPCAKVLPNRQLKISDEGEILLKGETLFKGYVTGSRLNLPLTPEGWFASGDLGELDAEGCLKVIGRKDNMFISGGENIQPEEIEKAILRIEGISQAVVVAKEDKEFGARPVAFIKFESKNISEEEIKQALTKDLPRFKIPIHFYPWPTELMTQGIKISRKEFTSRI